MHHSGAYCIFQVWINMNGTVDIHRYAADRKIGMALAYALAVFFIFCSCVLHDSECLTDNVSLMCMQALL